MAVMKRVPRSPKAVRTIEVMGLNRLKIGFTSSKLTIKHSDNTNSLFRAHSAIEIGAKVCHHGLNMTDSLPGAVTEIRSVM